MTMLFPIICHSTPPNYLLLLYLHTLPTPIYSNDIRLVYLPPLPIRLLGGGRRKNKAGQGEKGEGEGGYGGTRKKVEGRIKEERE